MTATNSRAEASPTKRWWRRHHGGVEARTERSTGFEFAHLLDPVGATVPADDAATVPAEDAAPVALGVPVAPDDAATVPVHDAPAVPVHDPEPVPARDVSTDAGAAEASDPWPFGDGSIDLPAEPPLGEVDALLAAPVPAAPIIESAPAEPPPAGPERTEPEPTEPQPEAATVERRVSRFATAGLDDDRLPIFRGQRAKRSRR